MISFPGFPWIWYIDKKILSSTFLVSPCLYPFVSFKTAYLEIELSFLFYSWRRAISENVYFLVGSSYLNELSIALAGGHGTELPPLTRVSCVAPTINLHRLVRSSLCLDKTIFAALILSVISTEGALKLHTTYMITIRMHPNPTQSHPIHLSDI